MFVCLKMDGKTEELRASPVKLNKSNKLTNATFNDDVNFAIIMLRCQLKPLGTWPISLNASIIEKISVTLIIIICSLLLGFVTIPGSLFTFIIVTDPSLQLKLTGVLSFCLMAICKYTSLVYERKNLAKCIDHIINDWGKVNSIRDKKIMLDYAQFGRYGAGICGAFMYGGALFYDVILPMVSGTFVNENNVTIRPLPYPAYYVIFDPRVTPTYEIIYITHCFCAFLMHGITSTCGCIAVTFIMHACGQLQVIIDWIENLTEESMISQQTDSQIFRIIDQHVRTLNFIRRSRLILCEICLVELVGCTLNICFLGYDILFEWEESDLLTLVTYHILLFSFTFNIFLFCFIGEFLKEKCKKVGYTAYMIKWYELSRENIGRISFIIGTAQSENTLTAGKMMDLTIETFGAVIKTSFVYLNLLRELIT